MIGTIYTTEAKERGWAGKKIDLSIPRG